MPAHKQNECGITVRQRDVLNSLKCERVSEDAEKNHRILGSFVNRYTDPKKGVLGHLRDSCVNGELLRETAVYIVKTQDDIGLLAFSLKCGELFEPICQDFGAFLRFRAEMSSSLGPDERILIEQEWADLIRTDGNGRGKRSIHDVLSSVERFLRLDSPGRSSRQAAHGGHCEARARGFVKTCLEEWKQKVCGVTDDIKREKNRHVARVARTRSGVQLVDFCKNEHKDATDVWNAFGLNIDRYSVGQVLFWEFVVPKVFAVRNIIGCDCMFLFAADTTDDGRLLAYYRQALKFQEVQNFGANKPVYDVLCPLMCQSIADLQNAHADFYANFNAQPGI